MGNLIRFLEDIGYLPIETPEDFGDVNFKPGTYFFNSHYCYDCDRVEAEFMVRVREDSTQQELCEVLSINGYSAIFGIVENTVNVFITPSGICR